LFPGRRRDAVYYSWRIFLLFILAVMEFFHNEDFDTAVPRDMGEAVMELLAQVRPNGRIMDHFRIALGGTSLLEVDTVLGNIIPFPALNNYRFKFQFWARDIAIRRNMTTSKWLDVGTIIASNSATISDPSGREIPAEVVMEDLDGIPDGAHKHAAVRYAVVIGPDQRMALEFQALPASAAVLEGKPSFIG
jgi:hypothetical protein